MNTNISKKVSLEANKLRGGLTISDVLASDKFQEWLQSYANSVLASHSYKVTAEYLPSSDVTAYTDGYRIYENTGNSIVQFYKDETAQIWTTLGIIFHECAHILYLDFAKYESMNRAIIKGDMVGKFPTPKNEKEKEKLERIEKAIADPQYSQILSTLYHNLENIFQDVHDETAIKRDYGTIINRALWYVINSLLSQQKSIEDMQKTVDDDNNMLLSMLFNVILSYARFDKVVVNDDTKLDSIPLAQKLEQFKEPIHIARTTDDFEERLNAMNEIIFYLWDDIEDELDPMLSRPQSGADSNEQSGASGSNASCSSCSSNSNSFDSEVSGSGSSGSDSDNSSNSNTASNMNNSSSDDNSNDSQTGSSANNGTDKNNSQADNSSNQSNQNNSGNSGDSNGQTGSGNSEADIRETVKKIVDELNKAAESVSLAESKGRKRKKSNKSESGAKCSNSDADKIIGQIINQIKKDMAQEKAESNVLEEVTNAELMMIDKIDVGSTHKGVPVNVENKFNVTSTDIAEYNRIYKDIALTSRALQRDLGALFEELATERTSHQLFGTKLNCNRMYRKECDFFDKKHLPGGVPEMAVAVLIDNSGSMSGSRIEVARKAAILLDDFTTGLNIPCMIAGHNDSCYRSTGIYYKIFTRFNSVKDSEKYSLMRMCPGGCNRDGLAIQITANLLAERPEEIKLMFIISDGQPNGDRYCGEPAARDIQSIITTVQRNGIQTFALAIGDDKENIKAIYKDGFIDISDLKKLPKMMTRIVERKLFE